MNIQHNLRSTPRLKRRSEDSWQLSLNHDELITRNIIDLGPRGLAFKGPKRAQFEKGQVVDIHVRLTPEKSFETKAKIIWVREHLFGLKFSKVPASIDAYIMKNVHHAAVAPLYEDEFHPNVMKTIHDMRMKQKSWEDSKMFSSTMGFLTIAAMTAALVAAIYINQQKFPERALATKLTETFKNLNHGSRHTDSISAPMIVKVNPKKKKNHGPGNR